MGAIRTLEMNGFEAARSYATRERAAKEAQKWAERIKGMVNVTITPVYPSTEGPRYTAVFSCFSDESDIFALARAGCGFMLFR